MFKEKMLDKSVYRHHDKIAPRKTHITLQNTEYTKTQQTLLIHVEINMFLIFFLFSVSFDFQFLIT